MYADQIDPAGNNASNDKPERPPTPEKHPSSPSYHRTQRHTYPPITNVMVLGSSGSGKSSLINKIGADNNKVASEGEGLCTTHLRTTRMFTLRERAFRLIDSPGFHTTSLEDSEIIKKILGYMVRPRDAQKAPRLSGILYIHPEENKVDDNRLKTTMESLRHLVGDPWLSFVTIAIVPGPDSDPITRFQESTSPFYTLYSRGAKVLSMPLESSRVQEVLLEFEPSPPLPRWTQKVRPSYYSGRPEGLDRFIEEITKVNRTESSNKTKRPPKITLEESEASRQQLQDTLDQTEAELQSLRSQLEQTQLEYASLRSELQLNDNTEQSKVVQSLNDLNRTIDDFGRSVAEYMVDNFAAILNKDDPTALDASNFTGLQRQFGHQGGKPSLAASSRGEGLPIEDVIDLALRSFLCQMLYKSVFLPFYPTLTTSAAPGFMDSLYEEIRRQVSPTVAAKWRASSFVALSQGNKFNHSVIESQVESLVMSDIQQLLSNIFGGADTVTLTDDQRKKLQDIVTLAWEFNYMLKGEVVTLGDFQPLCYERGTPFNPKTMVEFEPDKKRKPGDIAISTVRLGITLSYSKGIAQHAGPLIVCPATVITSSIYG
ncbi:hypothetical protein RSOLAG1IB_11615 [Rhizoctonia solani AG-1 IB]|uniref:G domain-containing protein n=1 Tax=Thanatephorus cucumeris (strain AG1-IB / isolate 7/3/14) TaxID=1108050 RepID=A0A0B7FDB8_THACB|nr:hypothetical protein RSOLAG1IB_11615 [Rhizoctonia solani AG-1 IB]